jgi:hypothetical protein
MFVSLSRNRTGAFRQFVSKASSATPELAFLACTAGGGGNDIGCIRLRSERAPS